MWFLRVACMAFLLLFQPAKSQMYIKGNFPSFPSTPFTIITDVSPLNGYQGKVLASDSIKNDGGFNVLITTPLYEQPALFLFSNQLLRIWLTGSGTMEINEKSSTFTFTGAGANENNFLYKAGVMQPFTPGSISAPGFQPTAEIKYLDSIEKVRRDLYDDLLSNKDVSSQFYNYCKGEISHFSHFSKNQYALRFLYMEKTIQYKDIPKDYFSFWSNFRLLSDECSSDMYHNSLRDYIGYLARKKVPDTDQEATFREQFRIMDSLLADRPVTLERQKADMLLTLIRYFDYPALTAQQVEAFKANYALSYANSSIQKEWTKKTAIVSTTPSFVLYDVSGKAVDIRSFRGKIVYIDFWGSWCKPCMAQMKHSAALQQQFKDKDVVFLFINFYDTEEKWKSTIKTEKLTGVHVKAEKDNEKYFDEMFGVKNGFPRYALIDRDGKLITVAAPHPGEEGVGKFLEEHLK